MIQPRRKPPERIQRTVWVTVRWGLRPTHISPLGPICPITPNEAKDIQQNPVVKNHSPTKPRNMTLGKRLGEAASIFSLDSP